MTKEPVVRFQKQTAGVFKNLICYDRKN